jgi:hypothetical protein
MAFNAVLDHARMSRTHKIAAIIWFAMISVLLMGMFYSDITTKGYASE